MRPTYFYTPDELRVFAQGLREWVAVEEPDSLIAPGVFVRAIDVADSIDRLLAGSGSYDEVNPLLEDLQDFMLRECSRLESRLSAVELSHLHWTGVMQ